MMKEEKMEKMIDQIEIFDTDHQDATNAFLHELLTNLRAEIVTIRASGNNIIVHYRVPVSEMPTEEEESD